MFEDCRRPRPVWIRGVVRALLITIMTVAITVPCIRLGQAIIKSSKASGTVRSTTDHEPEVQVQGERLAMSTVVTTLPALYQTPARVTNPDNRTPAKKQSQGYDTKPLGHRADSRSWNTDTIRDSHFVYNFRSSISRSKTPPKLVVEGKSIRQTPYSDDYEKTREVANVNEYIKLNVISNTGAYETNSRPNHRQFNEDDNSSLQTNVQKTEKDYLAGYKGSHGLNSNVGNRGSKESENSRDENGWTTIYRPGQILSESTTTSKDNDGSSRPSLGLGSHYTTTEDYNRFDSNPNRQAGETLNEYYSPTYGTYYGTQPIPEPDGGSPVVIPNPRPPVIPQPIITSTVQPFIPSSQQPMTIPMLMMRNINWRRIGFILTLVKLWMVKMKAIGFLKALFLLLFKFKFVLATLFFKFVLLLKLLLVLKFQVLPLLFLPLLPIMISLVYPMFTVGLLSVPGQIINTILGRVGIAVIPSASVSDSSSPSSGVVNNIPGSATIARPPVQMLKTVPDSIINPFDLFKGRSFDLADRVDPTIQDFFQKLISENCVRRMACEMVFAKKTGEIPSWMNEILRGVSKLLPSENLENYFKTYDYVNNQMYDFKSSAMENWTKWCLENYGCNNINVTNVTDTIH